MNRTILFSPVGGTDPMPQTNFRDGSMLHICRVYQPTDVYLYMSAEILKLHQQDNRYFYCLEKLAEHQNRTFHWEAVERPDLCDVQLFDTFYQDFRQIIKGITDDLDETDTLLLNISSGTPAMKSGLLVLATLGEYHCRLVQVCTPTRKMNEHRHGDYDIQALWELNEDNEEGFENRCQEVQCPSLSLLKQEQIIKKLVDAYDYVAAREVCEMLPESTTAAYLPWLDLACARLRLDFAAMNRLDKELDSGCIPLKAKGKQEYFEYALNLSIKREKKEYADFIRAITPLIVDLFSLIIKHECGIDIVKCLDDNQKWDKEKMSREYAELDACLNEAYYGNFKYGNVYSAHLLRILERYSQNSKLIAVVTDLRYVEERVRNVAAHEIVSLSEERIKRMTKGKDTGDIMGLIREAFKYTGIGVSPQDWDSYDVMNQKIKQAMP